MKMKDTKTDVYLLTSNYQTQYHNKNSVNSYNVSVCKINW